MHARRIRDGMNALPTLEEVLSIPDHVLQRIVHDCQLDPQDAAAAGREASRRSSHQAAAQALLDFLEGREAARGAVSAFPEKKAAMQRAVWRGAAPSFASATFTWDGRVSRSGEEGASRQSSAESGSATSTSGFEKDRRTFAWGSWGALPAASVNQAATDSEPIPLQSSRQRHFRTGDSGDVIAAARDDPYAPVHDVRRARRDLPRELSTLLSRAGFKRQSPDSAASLMLLRPSLLAPLAESCGLQEAAPSHAELANGLARLAADEMGRAISGKLAGDGGGAAGGRWMSFFLDGGGDAETLPGPDVAVTDPTAAALPAAIPTSSASSPDAVRRSRKNNGIGELLHQSVRSDESEMSLHLQSQRAAVLGSEDMNRRAVSEAVTPQLVAGWLKDAHALDVLVLGSSSSAASGASAADEIGAAVAHVIATGTSQRHVHTCAQAIRALADDCLERVVAESDVAPANFRKPKPIVIGERGMDWIMVDVGGAVAVHILTERARAFYDLESLFHLRN